MNRHNYDAVAAFSRVLEALELPAIDMYRLDIPRAAAAGDLDAARAFAAGAQVFDTLAQAAAFLGAAPTAPPSNFLAAVIMDNLADKIAESGSYLDLTIEPVVESILQGVLNETGVTLPDDVVSAAAEVIAAGNQLVDAVPITDGTAFLEAVARIQVVAQGTAADALATAGGFDHPGCPRRRLHRQQPDGSRGSGSDWRRAAPRPGNHQLPTGRGRFRRDVL